MRKTMVGRALVLCGLWQLTDLIPDDTISDLQASQRMSL